MSVKLLGGLPKGEHNGLKGIEESLQEHSDELVPLVLLCSVVEAGEVIATGELTAKLAIAEIERVDGDKARELLRAGRKARTGHEELDLEGLEVENDGE